MWEKKNIVGKKKKKQTLQGFYYFSRFESLGIWYEKFWVSNFYYEIELCNYVENILYKQTLNILI